MKEVWKEVKGYPNYIVSNYGRVRNIKTDREKKPRITSRGYVCFQLYVNNKIKTVRIQRLVALHFLPPHFPCNERLDVDHIDWDASNNRVDNLQWLTRKEHARKPRPYKRGAEYSNGKWKARLWEGNTNRYLGAFESREEAYQAFRKAYILKHGIEPWPKELNVSQ